MYIILVVQDLIDFANGKMFYGRQIGVVDNSGTSLALYNNEVAALNFVLANGYTMAVDAIRGWGPMKEYYLQY